MVLLVPAVVAALVAVTPLVYLVVRATENGIEPILDTLLRERTLRLVVRSLFLAVSVTAVTLVLGISLAWLTIRTTLPGRRFWAVVVTLPLAIPSYVAAFAWISRFPYVEGYVGSVIVLSACTYPYVLLPVAAALQRTDPALEEVSRSLGKGSVATFVGVTLRQVRPAAAAGGLLVALYVLSDFGAVTILRYDVFTRVIYTSYSSSLDRTRAAILGCVLVVVTVGIVLAESRARGRAGLARVGAGTARRQPRVRLRRWTPLALAWTASMTAVALGVPLIVLLSWLVSGTSRGIDVARLMTAAATTVWVSLLGAVLTVALAVPVGVIAARYRGRLPRLFEHATYAGHALPGIVVALAMVYLAVRYAFPLYQRTPVLVLAYAVLFLPAAVGAARTSVAQSPPVLEEVARSLGHSPGGVLRRVTLPLAAPGVLAGAVLVFLTCMKELPATLLLRPTEMRTLATELWTRTDVAQYAAAAPYAALLVLLAAVPTYLLGRQRGAVTLSEGGEA